MNLAVTLHSSASTQTQPLSDPRVAAVFAALIGSVLLLGGVSAVALHGGWKVVGWSAAGIGAVAVVVGGTGFALNRWTDASAAAAACAVAGIFGTLRLMTAGIRAQSMRGCFSLVLVCFAAPWAIGAVVAAVAARSATDGLASALIPAVAVYTGLWTILKGLLTLFGEFYDDDPPPAAAGPAMAAALGGIALVAAAVAVCQGLTGVLLRVAGVPDETRDIVGVCIGLGPIVLTVLFGLLWRVLPRKEAMASFGALFCAIVVAKSAALLALPALIAPQALLVAGIAWITAALVARKLSKPATTLRQDLA